MTNYLWVFVPTRIGISPFPLFWSNRNIGCITYDDLEEDYKKKLDYVFNDNHKNLSPTDGYIIGWSYLDWLDNESVLPIL